MESDISENQLMFSEFDKEIKRRIKDDDFPVDGDLPDPVASEEQVVGLVSFIVLVGLCLIGS